ncbi:hypothetical protein ETD86_42030, partial [Nonomuraea turkmeniaca]
MRGLGSPRGPEFRTLPMEDRPDLVVMPGGTVPRTAPPTPKAPPRGRLLVAAALVAAVTGAAAGVTGARLFEGSEPAPAAA